jgi:2-polyprenyl-3-methyl-5-hydroxy-6-metoxy-1,4-benzoquinol methylase
MVDLRVRSHQSELMDDMAAPGREVDRALTELAVVNRWLGGTRTTLAALAPRLRGRSEPMRILDLGAGGGDLALAMAELGRRTGVAVEIVTADLGGDACRFARTRTRQAPEIHVTRADAFALPFAPRSFHFAHCAMFLHHFRQEEIAQILGDLSRLVREGIIINDLHRNAFAYYSIAGLTRLFSRSRMVKNDAPLSVARGFRPADLDDLRARCGFARFRYRWRWAFRYLCEVEVG